MDDRVIISNGEYVQVNDHVYSAAPWGKRDSTLAYSIGRIMEFLPPEEEPKGKGKSKGSVTRVRLAWYYRPGDLSDRPAPDPRLLLAAIYSEVHPITYIRAKCYVRHRDLIPDLAAWKKLHDHFYFFRFFDPYIKKEYEVIQSKDVNNLPPRIKQELTSRYEFVVAEKEVVPDLIDNIRVCDTCSEWCPPVETVRCDSCKNYFHMGCVHPRLTAKPAKGYGWTCAPCSRKREERVDQYGIRSESPARISKVKLKGKSFSIPVQNTAPRKKISDPEIHHYKMWPFRYFGLYTVAEDTLDPDDLIFPRTATRVGVKYQAVCPPLLEGGPSKSASDPERGGDETIEIMGTICHMSDEEVAQVEKYKARLWHKVEQKSNVDFLEEAIRRYSLAHGKEDLGNVRMKGITRHRPWHTRETRFYDKEFNEEEAKTFESAIIALGGAEMNSIQLEIPSRTIPELVRYYGKWKNEQLGQSRDNIHSPRTPMKSNGFRKSSTIQSPPDESSDDESSIIDPAESAGSNGNGRPSSRLSCGACRSKESQYWWKPPRGFDLATQMLCDACSVTWRKYGDIKHRAEELVKSKVTSGEKRDGMPINQPNAKRIKGTSSASATPPPTLSQETCSCCKGRSMADIIVTCQKCNVSVHTGCAGVLRSDLVRQPWLCELCDNEKTLESSLNDKCLACHHIAPEKSVQSPGSYLRIMKPTEGRGWVHALCAIFIPELQFADSSRLRLVEGLGTVVDERRITACSVCAKTGGVIVKCNDTPDRMHASCAWEQGFHFGYELQPVKGARKDKESVLTTIKGETGVLQPVICRSIPRNFIKMCESDTTGQSVVQVYCRQHKEVQKEESYGLLRKARRLDASLPSSDTNGHLQPQCRDCHTNYSPIFWPVETSFLCHQCKAKTEDVGQVIPHATILA